MTEPAAHPPNRSGFLRLVPVLIFVALALVFAKGLFNDPSRLPSVLIGKEVPAFTLPPVENLKVPGFSDADLKKGGVTVVNLWASWCIPCRQEHPVLLQLSTRPDIRLVGINNKDLPDKAREFLATLGNPYAAVGADVDGRTTINWGGYGVPETFVVDGKGVIRHKHVGPLSPDDLTGAFSKEIEKAKTPL